ncbi:MAG: hypothetical protein QW666_03215 [Candidatus Woesearchaeota archaeon]
MCRGDYLDWNYVFHSAKTSEIKLHGRIGFMLVLDFDLKPEKKAQYLKLLNRYGRVNAEYNSSTIELFIDTEVKFKKFKKDALEDKLDGIICADHIASPPVQLTYEMKY